MLLKLFVRGWQQRCGQYCSKLRVSSSSVESGSQIRRQINLVSKENADFSKFLIFFEHFSGRVAQSTGGVCVRTIIFERDDL